MPLSTEVFVMCIFIIGWPFFYIILKDADLPGSLFFMAAYVLLTLSNIFTVVEEFWLNALFNFGEHLFITLASIMILIAVIKLTDRKKSLNIPPTPDESTTTRKAFRS